MIKRILFIAVCIGIPHVTSAQYRITGGPHKIVEGAKVQAMSPRWSPDSRYIAFTSVKNNGIWVTDPEGRELKQVTGDAGAGFGFRWSRDSEELLSRVSKYVFFRRRNGLKIYTVSSGAERIILDFQGGAVGLPQWSDADEKVLLTVNSKTVILESGREATALQKQNAVKHTGFIAGSRLGVKTAADDNVTFLNPLEGERYINLEMSPDGTKMVFEIVGGHFYVMNSDGSGLIDLGTGYRPRWSPDSRYIVYMVTEDNGYNYLKSDIYIIRADGTEKTRLTRTESVIEMNPAWSPVGDRIAYDVPGEGALYIIAITKQD